jgi:hypothetical protein
MEQLALPLEHKDWAFVNNSGGAVTTDNLVKLQSLGYVLSQTGIIPLDKSAEA